MENISIWTILQPEKLGAFPERMSFSTLSEIEACPRRYALSRGEYPEIWNRSGYPLRPSLKTLEGIVLHRSIEEIIEFLVEAGCSSVNDATFVASMRELKGYSGVFDRQLERLSKELSGNPRLFHKVSQTIAKIKNSVPTLREQLQNQISKRNLNAQGRTKRLPKPEGKSRALGSGAYSEVELNAREFGWFGKIDYLLVSRDACEIVDFKTGVQKSDHVFQIKLYNLLWLLDRERNPNFIPVMKLLLSYSHEDFWVQPLDANGVKDFVEQLRARTSKAKDQISKTYPEAIPSPENCSYCSVRQLCTEYWNQDTQTHLEKSKTDHSTFGKKKNIDLEVRLEDSSATHLWCARVLICGSIEPQQQVMIRFSPDVLVFSRKLKSGHRLRLLDVHLMRPSDEEDSMLTINSYWQSEIFKV